jgi:DNA replication protein DnaC
VSHAYDFDQFRHDAFGSLPEVDKRPPDVRRKEAVDLAECCDSTYWRERADWTDEQWAAEDARVEAERQKELQRREEDDRRRYYRQLEDLGWPTRALEAANNADTHAPAIKHIIEWDPGATNIIALSGPPGCGKTTAAAYRVLQRRALTVFVRASTFARTSRYDGKRDEWLNAPSLVLDDLGSEFADAKGSLQTDLDELIDAFYGDRRPLIITTNVTRDDFKKRYGERISDRFRECGRWFEIRAQSLRGKK